MNIEDKAHAIYKIYEFFKYNNDQLNYNNTFRMDIGSRMISVFYIEELEHEIDKSDCIHNSYFIHSYHDNLFFACGAEEYEFSYSEYKDILSEEGIFQYSTIYPFEVLEALYCSAYLHKMNCKTFYIDLEEDIFNRLLDYVERNMYDRNRKTY